MLAMKRTSEEVEEIVDKNENSADKPKSNTPTITEKKTVFISFDIEATGESPTTSSMVMLGCVACIVPEEGLVEEKKPHNWVLEEKQWCLEEVIFTRKDENNRCWNDYWKKHLGVWEFIQKNKIHPATAMRQLSDWLSELSKTYVVKFVAKPAAYDWMWLKSCYDLYSTTSSFDIGFKAQCINGFKDAAEEAGFGKIFAEYTTPKELKLTHYAVEDALAQGYLFLKGKEFFRKKVAIALPTHLTLTLPWKSEDRQSKIREVISILNDPGKAFRENAALRTDSSECND